MGNSASATRARRKLGDAIQTNVFQRSLPRALTPEEQEVLNRLAEREQERMQHLPSMEEINAKDDGLGFNLNKLVASISGRAVDVTGGRARQAAGGPPSTSAKASLVFDAPRHQPGSRRSVADADERGRLPSFLMRELLEQRNEAATSGRAYDVQQAATSYGCDPKQLSLLLEHCCIPQVGKVGSFGHQYAFARAPNWWRGQVSGAKFKSEPWEKMIKKSPAPEPQAEGSTGQEAGTPPEQGHGQGPGKAPGQGPAVV